VLPGPLPSPGWRRLRFRLTSGRLSHSLTASVADEAELWRWLGLPREIKPVAKCHGHAVALAPRWFRNSGMTVIRMTVRAKLMQTAWKILV
jgi:hypothetical protein